MFSVLLLLLTRAVLACFVLQLTSSMASWLECCQRNWSVVAPLSYTAQKWAYILIAE